MNNLILNAFVDWLAQNWIILALIVCAVALLVPTYIRQKKEFNARNELNTSIKKGVKIITTAGVYGTVESIEDTSDGKVVTIITGNAKNPTTMTIHINAIGGIDNKKPVVIDANGNEVVADEKPEVEEKVEEIEEKVEDKKATKKPAAKKSTTTKKSTTSKSTTKKTTDK